MLATYSFVLPTLAKDYNWYFGPKGRPEMWLEYEWDANNNPEIQQYVLHCTCVGMLLN